LPPQTEMNTEGIDIYFSVSLWRSILQNILENVTILKLGKWNDECTLMITDICIN